MDDPRAPRWRSAKTVSVVLAMLVLALGYGITTARVTSSFGPHAATYEITVDATVTVDLGPIGTVQFDSPAAPLGAGVVVQEIPADLTAVGSGATLERLSQDVESYVQFFSGPATTIEHAVRALVADAARRALGAVLVLALGYHAGRALLGERRRAELGTAFVRHRGKVAVAAVVTLAVAAVPGARPVPPPGPDRPGAVVFEGTALEGARITGRLAGVVDTYGTMLLDEIRANDAFYAAATESVTRAWHRAAPAEDPDDPDALTLLIISDLHCNVGMAGVIGTVAHLSGAEVLLDAGDTTVNGTAVESYCIQAVADALPGGVTQVVAGGNHDSDETAAQHREVGAVVLTGAAVEVEGLTILGDRDFQITRIGVGTTLAAGETMTQMGTRLAEVACREEDGVDLLLVHHPEVGDEAIASGCVRAQVSGHMHRRDGPGVVGQGVRYTSSSTAGAVLGGATIGPLQGTAEMTVLRVDRETGAVTDWRLVSVRTDGAAIVSPARPWPRPVPPELLVPDPPSGTPV